MADVGNKASFTFGTNTFDVDDCLQSWDFSHSINDIVYSCNGYDRHGVGTETGMVTVTLAINSDDTSIVTALDAGNYSSIFEAWPGGSTPGNIEVQAIRAQVNRCDISAPMNGIITLDVEFALDDITITTAA